MTDDRSQHESWLELTPIQEAAVRRLLAGARHDQPLPDEVATRLDAVLGQLARSPGVDSDPGASSVVDLGARRRRRIAARLLVAAAVVVGGGVVVGRVVGGPSSPAGPVATSSRATAEAKAEDRASGRPTRRYSTPSGANPSAPSAPGALGGVEQDSQIALVPGPALRLSSATFPQQVRRLRPVSSARSLRQAARARPGQFDSATGFRCQPATYGAGVLFAAYYDGHPAVLALRPTAAADNRVAELLQCGTGLTVRTALVPSSSAP